MLRQLLKSWISAKRGRTPLLSAHGARPPTPHREQGLRYESLGQLEAAQREFQAAIDSEAGDVVSRAHLGSLLGRRGDYRNAIHHLEAVLLKAPDNEYAKTSLANVLLADKQYAQAATAYERLVENHDVSAGVLCNLGLAYLSMHQFEKAESVLKSALTINPTLVEAYIHLGNLRKAMGQPSDAEASFRRGLSIDSSNERILKALTQLLREQGQIEDALDIAFQTIDAHRDLGVGYAIAGFLLQHQGKFIEAITRLETALELNPGDTDSIGNLAIAYQDVGRFEEAITLYDRALSADPNLASVSWHKSLAQLQVGAFEQGWPSYELRLLNQEPPPRYVPYPRWNGEPINNKHLLVYAEQGLGDEIMFASCIPDISRLAGHCTVECASKLASLFRRSFTACTIVGTDRHNLDWRKQVGEVDYAVPIGSLPLHFRKSATDFPQQSGYLTADPPKVAFWKEQLDSLGAGLKIGISWKGGTSQSRQFLRSIPLEQWQPILSIPNTHFVNLQYTNCERELAEAEANFGTKIHHWQQAIDDYDETAALVCALDLVISVQTALIHLCGALGRPVWIMVPVCAEWRYGHAGDQMIWYPAARLFRQTHVGDWAPLIGHICSEVAQLASSSNSRTVQ